MEIEGVGEQLVRRLWKEGLVTSMPDLYRLDAEQLAQLEGYGEVSAAKAVERAAAGRERVLITAEPKAVREADRIVLPLDQQPHFSEKIVHLPGCYQANDATRIVPRAPSRASSC